MPCSPFSRVGLPRALLLAAALQCAAHSPSLSADDPPGHRPTVKVTAPTRIDWIFAVANQSLAQPPVDWLKGYDSTAQTYELYVPASEKSAGGTSASPPGVVLFISPSDKGTGLEAFRKTCDAERLIFVSPHRAGNGVDTRQRVRIVLDVLDDVRRRYTTDVDRTYIGGFSGGGRIACAIAFSLPEHFGGVLPVCAAGDLREESWLRRRVVDRLSVAHLTGDNDFNRGEIERFRAPLLAGVGVRSKVWIAPKVGHAIPPAAVVSEAVSWLEDGLAARRKLAQQYPASRAPADEPPTRQEQAKQLFAEGNSRLADTATLYAGLMQLKGVLDRWPDVSEAQQAKATLLKQEQSPDRTWEDADLAEQRLFLLARAKGLSDYAVGPLPQQYQAQRAGMARAAIELWTLIIDDNQDAAAVAEAQKRLAVLRPLVSDKDK